jgi:hypothetical protein
MELCRALKDWLAAFKFFHITDASLPRNGIGNGW